MEDQNISSIELLHNIKIVLVGTTHPGNIGASARAMKNMGLSNLILVEPKDFLMIKQFLDLKLQKML